MRNIIVPLSPYTEGETVDVRFETPKELNLEEAVEIGNRLFGVLYSQCPSIVLRALENNLILHSPKIQELAEKANRWDDYYLQRLRAQEEAKRDE